ncbi:heptaprenyl diphosphate synthase [Acutalibacter sp. 1XD8-33]|uniref:Gx transporter family protein n=1 Tax=Acutalibacter sp. 1XD8-33 TaxID=2320081 RepID=UPI000EA0C316|nr:Gx transporter family protein [Acutalibacter sp. 1XD8-33]RKJ41710.1 heptaprenyl diphosphate synthase [Acutalibacter sp. 1XD8-33]
MGKSGRIALSGMLAALALALSFLEGLLPPLPGMPPGAKMGLSNIAVMYAAGSIGLPCALGLALVKGIFALLTRGFTAGLMSLSGGLVSTLCMWLLLKKSPASLSLTGVCGALTHNFAQLVVAYWITVTSVTLYVPFLLIFSLLTGILTGSVLKLTLPLLEKLNIANAVQKR